VIELDGASPGGVSAEVRFTTSDSTSVTLPTGVKVPAGQSSVSFAIGVPQAVQEKKEILITATMGTVTKDAILVLLPGERRGMLRTLSDKAQAPKIPLRKP
jgi:hypothetical protein